jgi:hypothetical protein
MNEAISATVMPGLVPGIHVFIHVTAPRRGWPGIGEPSDAVLRTAARP